MVRPFGKRRVQAQAEYLKGVAIAIELSANAIAKERATGHPANLVGVDVVDVLSHLANGLQVAGEGWVKEVSG